MQYWNKLKLTKKLSSIKVLILGDFLQISASVFSYQTSCWLILWFLRSLTQDKVSHWTKERFEVRQQGSINCAHGDEPARNVHAKRFSRAPNYLHVNQSKYLWVILPMLLKVVSYFCVWNQIIFSTIRSEMHNLVQRSCC